MTKINKRGGSNKVQEVGNFSKINKRTPLHLEIYKFWTSNFGQKKSVFRTNISNKINSQVISVFPLIFAFLSKLTVSIVRKQSSSLPLLIECLPKSLVIEFLSISLVENKVKIKHFYPKTMKIGPEKIFKCKKVLNLFSEIRNVRNLC